MASEIQLPDGFVRTDTGDVEESAFRLIDEDWMLVTAGTPDSGLNTMTASWGALGELWSRRVAFAFVRPQRHTYRFMEENGLFTLSFFPEEQRDILKYCGTHSGRDVDKVAETGLRPFVPVEGATGFEQARLVLVCRKLYTQDLDPDRFIDPAIEEMYPEKGYHRMYVGEIVSVLRRSGA